MALVEHCTAHTNFCKILPLLFQYLRTTDTPTPLKEVVMGALAKVVHSLKMKTYKSRTTDKRDEKENEPIWIALRELQDELFLFYKVCLSVCLFSIYLSLLYLLIRCAFLFCSFSLDLNLLWFFVSGSEVLGRNQV
jgi:hypothetical protein